MKYLLGNNLTKIEALAIADGDELSFDIETYSNYFLAVFYRVSDQTVISFDSRGGFEKKKLLWALANWKTYGFNSLGFDLPICVAYCQADGDSHYAYSMASDIINNQALPSWKVLATHGLKNGWRDQFKKNHYDLMGPAFGRHGLKFYAAVLGAKTIMNLPYEPQMELTDPQMDDVFHYCVNDCVETSRLRNALEGPLNIRKEFGLNYGIDLRSLQDAKVAEMLLVQDYRYNLKRDPEKPTDLPSRVFYHVPDYVKFTTEPLQKLLEELDGSAFDIVEGKVKLGFMEGRVITVAGKTYKMGIGGLHSQEKTITHKATADLTLIDCDVASYYPSLILRNGSYPPALGQQFLKTYQNFVSLRVAAKKNGNKLMADGFKIPLNATFGKLGEQFGYLYAPDLLVGVTLTGQLCLLMLIEQLTVVDFEVISANTDGVITKVPTKRLDEYRTLLKNWMATTSFDLEETHYSTIYSRDVNNYIAFYADGSGYKSKGAYSKYGLSSLQAKVPDCQIVKDAVIKYLDKGISIDHTIRNCQDILQFTRASNVKSGGYFKGERLGKVVRYYYSKTSPDAITNQVGHKVPEAWNVTPCMTLPESIPSDLSYDTYIARARNILNNDFREPLQTLDLFA